MSPQWRPFKKLSPSRAAPSTAYVKVPPSFSASVKTGTHSMKLSSTCKCLKNKDPFYSNCVKFCPRRVKDGEDSLIDILNLIQFGDEPQFALLSMAFKKALSTFDSTDNLPFLFLDIYDAFFGQVKSIVFLFFLIQLAKVN